jgi:hypothetical protein
MKVVPFVPRRSQFQTGPWNARELDPVLDACATPIARGEVGGWDTGLTEAGDPQLYLLGPAPGHDCLLCISRLGGRYVLEDGQGRLLFEHDAIMPIAEKVQAALARKRPAMVARLVAGWVAAKAAFEERVEPILAEPIELFTHVGPQLAALV